MNFKGLRWKFRVIIGKWYEKYEEIFSDTSGRYMTDIYLRKVWEQFDVNFGGIREIFESSKNWRKFWEYVKKF